MQLREHYKKPDTNNFDKLFTKCYENYRINLFFSRLEKYIKEKLILINSFNVLQSQFKAYVIGKLCGLKNKDIASILRLRVSYLKKKICNKLSPIIKGFFNLELGKRMDWDNLGEILEQNGYKKYPLDVELSRISKPFPIKASEIITRLEQQKLALYSPAISDKLTEAERIELRNKGDISWNELKFSEALESYEAAINGDLSSYPSSECLMAIIAGFENLEAYDQCHAMIKFAEPYIRDDSDLSYLYLYRASYYDELSLVCFSSDYWQDARSNYQLSLKYEPDNIWTAWNLTRLTIKYHQKCQTGSWDLFDYSTIAKNDFNCYFKAALNSAKLIPKEIRNDIKEVLDTLDDQKFRIDIIDTISKFDNSKEENDDEN